MFESVWQTVSYREHRVIVKEYPKAWNLGNDCIFCIEAQDHNSFKNYHRENNQKHSVTMFGYGKKCGGNN